MAYSKKEILGCLEKRLRWYKEAVRKQEDKFECYDISFDFPEGNIENWKGCIKELQNTIDMLKVKQEIEQWIYLEVRLSVYGLC